MRIQTIGGGSQRRRNPCPSPAVSGHLQNGHVSGWRTDTGPACINGSQRISRGAALVNLSAGLVFVDIETQDRLIGGRVIGKQRRGDRRGSWVS